MIPETLIVLRNALFGSIFHRVLTTEWLKMLVSLQQEYKFNLKFKMADKMATMWNDVAIKSFESF